MSKSVIQKLVNLIDQKNAECLKDIKKQINEITVHITPEFFENYTYDEVTINNRNIDMHTFEDNVLLDYHGDNLDVYREEYNQILKDKLLQGKKMQGKKNIVKTVN